MCWGLELGLHGPVPECQELEHMRKGPWRAREPGTSLGSWAWLLWAWGSLPDIRSIEAGSGFTEVGFGTDAHAQLPGRGYQIH